MYIGQTIRKNPLDRYRGSLLNTHNNHLKSSICKYGEENFSIEIICKCDSKEEMNEKEIYYINFYNSLDDKFGYNEASGGIGGCYDDKIKEKISKTLKKERQEHPEKWANQLECCKGENNPMHKKGGHTQESKEKMSKTKKELFKQGKLKMSESAIINSHTPEAKQKRKESQSKFWFIQYDKNFNEIIKFHTLHDLYDYLVEQGIETKRKTYGGFKNKHAKEEVFNEKGYNGYYFKKVNKIEYANTEVIN